MPRTSAAPPAVKQLQPEGSATGSPRIAISPFHVAPQANGRMPARPGEDASTVGFEELSNVVGHTPAAITSSLG
ncbi:hypothetical protein [Saccharopolyspora pogona]|uniref:hypothetical protein n=1 Tax=Saccharopolyspora pogona TaxID=333966 RepID=UPI001683414F|nr:hypothetical protein [Saccharopolyspora pogona]